MPLDPMLVELSSQWTDFPVWELLLSSQRDLEHRAWLEAGRQGEGRIALRNCNLNGANFRGSELSFSEFINCYMRGADLCHAHFEDAELVDCYFDNSVANGLAFETLLYGCRFDRAIIQNCQFTKTRFNISKFVGSHIFGGDWSETDFDTTTWTDAEVENVNFQQAHWVGARLHNTRFIRCDLRGADFVATEAFGTFFDQCDFRGIDLKSLRVKNATFYKCGFYNCANTPRIEGAYTIVAPDLSENFDGSNIVDPQKLYQNWGAAPVEQPA